MKFGNNLGAIGWILAGVAGLGLMISAAIGFMGLVKFFLVLFLISVIFEVISLICNATAKSANGVKKVSTYIKNKTEIKQENSYTQEEKESSVDYCYKCGTKLSKDREFCHKCGTKVYKG